MDQNKYRLLICLKFLLKKYSKQETKIWKNSDSVKYENYIR